MIVLHPVQLPPPHSQIFFTTLTFQFFFFTLFIQWLKLKFVFFFTSQSQSLRMIASHAILNSIPTLDKKILGVCREKKLFSTIFHHSLIFIKTPTHVVRQIAHRF